jgi:hypothetical protein
MIHRIIETESCCGVEMNVEEAKVISISREASPLQIVINQKQMENAEYFSCLGSTIDDERSTREDKFRTAMTKTALNRKKIHLTSKLDVDLRKKLVKCYIWSLEL